MKDIMGTKLVKGDLVYVATQNDLRLAQVLYSSDTPMAPSEVVIISAGQERIFPRRHQLALYSNEYRTANLSHLITLFGNK